MRFAGYAALFDRVDRGGDIIRKGAFSRAAKAGIPLLWQHDPTQRIGYIEQLAEDARGLRVIAQVDAQALPKMARHLQRGQGLSFGYRVRGQRAVNRLRERRLPGAELAKPPLAPAEVSTEGRRGANANGYGVSESAARRARQGKRASMARSIGQREGQSEARHERQSKGQRELTDLDLIEVSLVSHPMQPAARILAVEE